jgi:hypothetical protein
MPRMMPRFDRELMRKSDLAMGIVRAGEYVRVKSPARSFLWRQWSLARLEALYELAFLRMFVAWETCLEEVFFRSLCGYASAAGQETLVIGRHHASRSAAERAVMGGRPYLAWHNPSEVIKRCQAHIRSRDPAHPSYIGQQEAVVASQVASLTCFANIRHRIAHGQNDAKMKFDLATLSIAGRTYRGSCPGRFLRDVVPATVPPKRWLTAIGDELVGLLRQII